MAAPFLKIMKLEDVQGCFANISMMGTHNAFKYNKTTPTLFPELHHQFFPIPQGELGHHIYKALFLPHLDHGGHFVPVNRFHNQFLVGGLFPWVPMGLEYLDKIHLKIDGGAVLYLQNEIGTRTIIGHIPEP